MERWRASTPAREMEARKTREGGRDGVDGVDGCSGVDERNRRGAGAKMGQVGPKKGRGMRFSWNVLVSPVMCVSVCLRANQGIYMYVWP